MTERAVEALKDDPELKELREGWKVLECECYDICC